MHNEQEKQQPCRNRKMSFAQILKISCFTKLYEYNLNALLLSFSSFLVLILKKIYLASYWRILYVIKEYKVILQFNYLIIPKPFLWMDNNIKWNNNIIYLKW